MSPNMSATCRQHVQKMCQPKTPNVVLTCCWPICQLTCWLELLLMYYNTQVDNHISIRFSIGVEGRNRLQTAEVNATLWESRICQILEYLQATHPKELALWINLKWRCTIDTLLPDLVTVPLTHYPLQLWHVSQVELRTFIRHIEVAICANNPVQDIGDDFTYLSGHNAATHYMTAELNETIR